MTETLTESFCERCGTRYTFHAARPRGSRLGRARTFSRGVRNFVMSEDSFSESMADARNDDERAATSVQLDAFHQTFNFCMSCRQYTCSNCWNEGEARCLSCAPIPGSELEPEPDLAVAESPVADWPVSPAPAAQVLVGEASVEPILAASWPAVDLPPAPVLRPEPERDPIAEAEQAAELAAQSEAEHEVEEDGSAWVEAQTPEGLDPSQTVVAPVRGLVAGQTIEDAIAAWEAAAPVVAGVAAPTDAEVAVAAEVIAEAEILEAEPEPEPVVAAVIAEPEPEPVVAEVIAEAEPEPVAAALEPEPEPEPEPVVAAVEAEPEPEPVVAAVEPEPEPEPVVAAVEPEPLAVAPEPEPIAAEAAPELAIAEPEPVVAVIAEPEPEPIAAALEPEPEPEPVVAEVEAEPEPEPVVAAVEPEPLAVVPEPEPVAAVAPEPVPLAVVVPEPEPLVLPEPAPVAAVAPEPESLAAAAALAPAVPELAPTPSSPWLTVAPDDGTAPTWPSTPSWPAPSVRRDRPASIAGRAFLPEGDAAAVWAASAREVLAAGAPKATATPAQAQAQAQAQPTAHPCVGCALPLSANARFCRRCGSRQG